MKNETLSILEPAKKEIAENLGLDSNLLDSITSNFSGLLNGEITEGNPLEMLEPLRDFLPQIIEKNYAVYILPQYERDKAGRITRPVVTICLVHTISGETVKQFTL